MRSQVAAFLAPYQRAAALLRAHRIPRSRAGNPFARDAPWKREVGTGGRLARRLTAAALFCYFTCPVSAQALPICRKYPLTC